MLFCFYCVVCCIEVTTSVKTKPALVEIGKEYLAAYHSDIKEDTKLAMSLSEDVQLVELVQALADDLMSECNWKSTREVKFDHCRGASFLIFPEWVPIPISASAALEKLGNSTEEYEASLFKSFFRQHKEDIRTQLRGLPKHTVTALGVSARFVEREKGMAHAMRVCFVFWKHDKLMDQLYLQHLSLGTTAMLLAFEYALRHDSLNSNLKQSVCILHDLDILNNKYRLTTTSLRIIDDEKAAYEFLDETAQAWVSLSRLDLSYMKHPVLKSLFGYGVYNETVDANGSIPLKLIVYRTSGVFDKSLPMQKQTLPKVGEEIV